MIIATAGHVDHGKTSIVNALTGIDTDRLAEEKKRGLTIDLGFAYSDSETGHRLGFVDVPGHIKFISNMLAGVAAIDFALLVVAADDGVMPQTIEHLEILDLLGISAGLVALTKIDRCDANRVTEVQAEITDLIANTSIGDADIFPVSSITGEGMDMLQLALDIAADDIERKSQHGQFRLSIDRSFSIKGAGMVVTGSVFSGSVNTGDELLLMPQNIPVRVRTLHTQNQPTETARAGDRCAVNITSNQLELADIHRGNWLTTNTGSPTARADVTIKLLGSEDKPLSHWTPVHIHAAANHVTGRVAILEAGKIEPGAHGLAQLVFEPPINLCTGDRIIIRDQAATRTLGGGVVLDPYSPKRGRAKPERITYLHGIEPRAAGATLRAILKRSNTGLSSRRFRESQNLTEDEYLALLDDETMITLEDGTTILTGMIGENCTRLEAILDAWHHDNPAKKGLPLNQLHQQFMKGYSKSLAQFVVARMLESGELMQSGNMLNRPGFDIQLSSAETKLWNATLPLLEAARTKPPVLHDLAKSVNADPKVLEKALNQVVKIGLLVRPVKNRYFLIDSINELRELLRKAAGEKGEFSVQQFRDISGIGRNLCIELLEYFDRQGITRRVGDVRKIMEK